MCIEIADACRDANFNLRIYVPRGARALEGPIVTKGIHCKSMFVPPTQGLQRDYHFTPAMLPLCPPPWWSRFGTTTLPRLNIPIPNESTSVTKDLGLTLSVT